MSTRKITMTFFIERGEMLSEFDTIDTWTRELEEKNRGKEGRKLVYQDSVIKLLGFMHVYYHLPYKQIECVL